MGKGYGGGGAVCQIGAAKDVFKLLGRVMVENKRISNLIF